MAFLIIKILKNILEIKKKRTHLLDKQNCYNETFIKHETCFLYIAFFKIPKPDQTVLK